MKEEIKETIELINTNWKDYYLDDFLSGEEVKNLVDYTINLQKENVKLNNIINELENHLKNRNNFLENRLTMNKLKELKEGK